MGFEGGGFAGLGATQTVPDDGIVYFGAGGPSGISWDTTDANANTLMFQLPTGGTVDVPAAVFGIGIFDVDLAMFNGITQPFLGLIDADRDSHVGFFYSADDVAVVRMSLAAGTVRNHTIPNVASDTFAVLDATQTFAGAKTFSANVTMSAADIRWSSGVAVTAGQYSIFRDTAATNRMVLNVPTSATYLISVNGTSIWALSPTAMNYTSSQDGSIILFEINNTSNTASSGVRLLLTVAGGSAANPDLQFQIEGAERVALGLDNAVANRFAVSQGSAVGTDDRLRFAINTGILDLDGTSALTAAVVGLFDDLDDALVLRSLFWGDAGLIPTEQRERNRQMLYQRGVLTPKDSVHDPSDPGGYFISVQPMIHLLAGGIYQTRMMVDNLQQELRDIIQAQGQRIALLERQLHSLGCPE